MKTVFILLVWFYLPLLAASQNADANKERCPVAGETCYCDSGYTISRSYKDTLQSKTWFVKGREIGFRYAKNFDCPDMFDEEYTDNLVWSILPGIDSFFYEF